LQHGRGVEADRGEDVLHAQHRPVVQGEGTSPDLRRRQAGPARAGGDRDAAGSFAGRAPAGPGARGPRGRRELRHRVRLPLTAGDARFTKIIATLGPATAEPRVLVSLLRAGVDVARLNLSHGTHASSARVMAALRRAASETGRAVA